MDRCEECDIDVVDDHDGLRRPNGAEGLVRGLEGAKHHAGRRSIIINDLESRKEDRQLPCASGDRSISHTHC